MRQQQDGGISAGTQRECPHPALAVCPHRKIHAVYRVAAQIRRRGFGDHDVVDRAGLVFDAERRRFGGM